MNENIDIIREALVFKINNIDLMIDDKYNEIESLENELDVLKRELRKREKPSAPKEPPKKFTRLKLSNNLRDIALSAIIKSKFPKTAGELFNSLDLDDMPKFDSFRATLSKLVSHNEVMRVDGRYSLPPKEEE